MIEDDVDMPTFLVDYLKMLGYTVTEASHGRAGLERLHADNPDLLMVDFAMPGMNGLEVIAEAKRSRPQLPVILATGYVDADVSKDCVEGYAVLVSDRRPCAHREGCADALACVTQQGLRRSTLNAVATSRPS